MDPLAFQLHSIFAPHENERRNDLIHRGRRLIHYTSAVAAISIIRNGNVWMRNVRCMNDFMEVEHGFQLMQRSFELPVDSESEKGLRATIAELDSIFPELGQECIDWFNGWLPYLRNNTYVTCLSEHDQSEWQYGRLSMWRAYTANQVGVGLVINPLPLYGLADAFGAYSSPVYYFGDGELRDTFLKVAANIRENRALIEGQGREEIKGYFCLLLRAIAMCTKHPGFVEEKEWRIMHTEKLDERGALEQDVEFVNGVPQPVFKIPLRDHDESGMKGISIPDFLEGVIVGPTQYPAVVADAFILELAKVGVADPETKVHYSAIPLRT